MLIFILHIGLLIGKKHADQAYISSLFGTRISHCKLTSKQSINRFIHWCLESLVSRSLSNGVYPAVISGCTDKIKWLPMKLYKKKTQLGCNRYWKPGLTLLDYFKKYSKHGDYFKMLSEKNCSVVPYNYLNMYYNYYCNIKY